jgi:hypothetical protein
MASLSEFERADLYMNKNIDIFYACV